MSKRSKLLVTLAKESHSPDNIIRELSPLRLTNLEYACPVINNEYQSNANLSQEGGFLRLPTEDFRIEPLNISTDSNYYNNDTATTDFDKEFEIPDHELIDPQIIIAPDTRLVTSNQDQNKNQDVLLIYEESDNNNISRENVETEPQNEGRCVQN